MKKFARFLCFALLSVLLCTTFASCSGAEIATPADAKAALQEAGYVVTMQDAEHELAAFAKLGATGVTAVIYAHEAEGDEVVYVYCFADEATATAALEAVKVDAAERKAELAEGLEWVEPAVSGSMILFGSADGVAVFE